MNSSLDDDDEEEEEEEEEDALDVDARTGLCREKESKLTTQLVFLGRQLQSCFAV